MFGQWASLFGRLGRFFESFICADGVTSSQVIILCCALARKYILVHSIWYPHFGRFSTFSYAKNVFALPICCENAFACIHSYPKCLQKVNLQSNNLCLAEKVNEFMRDPNEKLLRKWFYHLWSNYCWPRCRRWQPAVISRLHFFPEFRRNEIHSQLAPQTVEFVEMFIHFVYSFKTQLQLMVSFISFGSPTWFNEEKTKILNNFLSIQNSDLIVYFQVVVKRHSFMPLQVQRLRIRLHGHAAKDRLNRARVTTAINRDHRKWTVWAVKWWVFVIGNGVDARTILDLVSNFRENSLIPVNEAGHYVKKWICITTKPDEL